MILRKARASLRRSWLLSPGATTIAAFAAASTTVGGAVVVNGWTVPTASARVRIAQDAPGELDSGWITGSHGVGVFHYGELYALTDRLAGRLTVAVAAACVALALAGLAALVWSRANADEVARGLGWRAIAAAMIASGLALPGAVWWQAAAVLTAAGRPEGLTPYWDPHVGWVIGGLVLIAATQGRARPPAFGRPPSRRRASSP